MRTHEQEIRWDELAAKGWTELTKEEMNELEVIAQAMHIIPDEEDRKREQEKQDEVDAFEEARAEDDHYTNR